MDAITKTEYVTETGSLSFSPTATIESTITVTTEYQQTYTVTLGQTVTILPIWPSQTRASDMPFDPAPSDPLTVTMTEVVVILQNPQQTPYSTRTIPISPTDANNPYHSQLSPYLLVISPDEGSPTGWKSWHSAQKSGLIAGIVVAFLLIVAVVVFWLKKRKRVWIANDWSVSSHPAWGVHQPGQGMVYSSPNYGWRNS